MAVVGRTVTVIFNCCILFIVISAEQHKNAYRKSFINPYPRYKLFNDGGDTGEPLFLTPFIRNSSIPRSEIRDMAQVNGTEFLQVKSFAGYLTVNPSFNSNMFFWYFPSINDSYYDPVVLWLQGGPGASSLFGLFVENGPFTIDDNGNLGIRNYSWHNKHNMIYIDNPVGTGFSFTDDTQGYSRNEKSVGHNLHEAIQQLYELFEWNKDGSFWITGESYAGKYIPALAYHIHRVQNSIDTTVRIPLKGLAIGNGLSDPIHQLHYGSYLYQLGLIDDNGLQTFQAAEMKAIKYIEKREMEKAFDVFDNLLNGDLSNHSIFYNLTGFNYYYNYLHSKHQYDAKSLGNFLQSSSTRRNIHVGNKTFHDLDTTNKVEEYLKLDIMDTVAPWIAELLKNYHVCIYNGQLDIIVAYPLTRNYLNRLKFDGQAIYKNASRLIWKEDGEIAGYVKKAGFLTEIMVRNAGHMAPADQPKWLYSLINKITHEEPFFQ